MSRPRIPITLIAGFLGSGKTTLLNHILTGEHGLKVAVLVNDFGEINIDSRLITNIEGETISLANGCVCCTIRDDLARAVRDICDGSESFDYIITETSGVSEPAAAAMGLVMPPDLSARIQIDAIITVVDADQVLELDEQNRHLATDQVEAADIVIINKTDLVDDRRIAAVRAWLGEQAPKARVVEASYGRVPVSILINTMAHGTLEYDQHDHAAHDTAYTTWSYSEERPLAFQSIYEMFRNLPHSVYRGKGILNLREVPDRQVVLQMVGKRVSLSRGSEWQDQVPHSQVVLIAGMHGLDTDDIKQRFSDCVAGDNDAPDNRLADAVIQILRA